MDDIVPALSRVATTDLNENVRLGAIDALLATGDERVLPVLEELARGDRSSVIRAAASRSLGARFSPRVLKRGLRA